jgi:nicotinate (nicotinamide) nucleotide adenylyltransferase
MAYLATMDEDWLFVDPVEIARGRHHPGPSYTIDTLHSYHMRYPDIPITLIVGADNIAFHRWKDVDQFRELLTRIVAVARPDYETKFVEDLKQARIEYPRIAAMVEFVGDLNIPTSSTAVRESLRKGRVPADVLHPAVSHHILKYGLYGCKEACTP